MRVTALPEKQGAQIAGRNFQKHPGMGGDQTGAQRFCSCRQPCSGNKRTGARGVSVECPKGNPSVFGKKAAADPFSKTTL